MGFRGNIRPLVAFCAVLTAFLPACGTSSAPRAVNIHSLEAATCVPLQMADHRVVSDVGALGGLYCALGPQLGLVQIRSAQEWEHLRRAVPGLGRSPDFSRGMVVGLINRAGVPLDGRWPIELEAVRVYQGAGLVEGNFYEGVYLPDGTSYLETAYIDGLNAVLIVNVNGARFYPNP